MLTGVFDVSYPARAATIARRLDELSERLAGRAHRLAAASGTGGWDGPAAHAFRRNANELFLLLRHATASLEQAAAAVRRHGAAVQRVLDGSGGR